MNPTEKKDQPVLPPGYYPINKEDKAIAQEIGRKLEKFFIDEAATRGDLDLQVIIAACDYVVTKNESRLKAIFNKKFEPQRLDINGRVKEANAVVDSLNKEAVAFQDSQKEYITSRHSFLQLINDVDSEGLAGNIPEPLTHVEEEVVEEAATPTDMEKIEAEAQEQKAELSTPADAPTPSPYNETV